MKDKVVIITGGSSGIGKALALEFGKKGSKVVITGRNASRLNEAAKEFAQHRIAHTTVVADVSKEEDNKTLVEKVINEFGQIDILINNAGVSMRALFEDVDLDVIRQLMDINFYGTVYATKYALPHIIKNQGSVVGISSIAGNVGLPGRSGYSASKFAMQGFLDTIRVEMRERNVHVLVACPGFTASNIRKAALNKEGKAQGGSPRNEGKMMSSEEVAQRIYRAVQKRKRSLVLTREGKLAVFMNKWLPGVVEKSVYNKMAKEPDSPLKTISR